MGIEDNNSSPFQFLHTSLHSMEGELSLIQPFCQYNKNTPENSKQCSVQDFFKYISNAISILHTKNRVSLINSCLTYFGLTPILEAVLSQFWH